MFVFSLDGLMDILWFYSSVICHIGVSLVVFASRSCMCALPRNEICSQYIKSLSACLQGISISFALLELIVSGGI